MESLGSKTASCITPEELWFPLHRNASLFILYIYHQWFWSMFWKKPKPIKKYKIHISASGKPRSTIDHISFWLQGVYIKSIMQVLNTLSPHTSSNLHFCVVLTCKGLKVAHTLLHSSKWMSIVGIIIDNRIGIICCWNVVKCNKINISCGINWCKLIDADFNINIASSLQ